MIEILINEKIKSLFRWLLISIFTFISVSIGFIYFNVRNAELFILLDLCIK